MFHILGGFPSRISWYFELLRDSLGFSSATSMTSKSLLLLCFWAVSTAGGPCTNPPPIALPVTDVRLSNGYTMRGTPVSIGNPAQNFSMMPHMYATYLSRICNNG